MTIKEFAQLCGCNPQTLRYYDRVDLLKPIRVDRWSGYRFYEEEQALAFVKIRSLQKAGFTIEEIKGLLDRDNRTVVQAFDAKIAEEETRLREIKKIRASYQAEMEQIQEKVRVVREKVIQSMRAYDPAEEFGIHPEQYTQIMDNVNRFFEDTARSAKDIGYREFDDADAPDEEREYLDLLHNPAFAVVYEKHGWERVRDFFDEFSTLADGAEYALVFQVDPTKNVYNQAFSNTILGMLLAKNPGKKRSLSCNIEASQDGRNHFWLLKRR